MVLSLKQVVQWGRVQYLHVAAQEGRLVLLQVVQEGRVVLLQAVPEGRVQLLQAVQEGREVLHQAVQGGRVGHPQVMQQGKVQVCLWNENKQSEICLCLYVCLFVLFLLRLKYICIQFSDVLANATYSNYDKD